MGSAVDLATGNRSWVERGFDAPWVNFCMKQVTLMQAAGVTPVVSPAEPGGINLPPMLA